MTEKKLGFKDFLTVDDAPGMDPIIKKNAKKRKSETSSVGEAVVDEALNPTQRRARGRIMKRFKAKIQLGAKRARNRTASMDKIKTRAMKQARTLIFKKLTKGVAKSELPFQRRQEIEKRLSSPAMKRRIQTIAMKLIPKARRDDMERKQAKSDDDKK